MGLTLGNTEITFTCNAISMERYNEIQERILQVDKKGNIQGFATAQAKIETVLAGVPELRSEELMKHFKSPFTLWQRIKSQLWWWFKATEQDKAEWDWLAYGHAIMKDGKRINPKKFFNLKD